ncbi:MAG: ergothioneine biosynthesis protein EgtB [Holophagaceae bacterium]
MSTVAAPAGTRYAAVRARTEALAAPLSAEDACVQAMPDASPAKWHLAHTTWFFETFLLRPRLEGYRDFHPAFGYLFNSYYNAVGERHPRPRRGLLTRPSLDEVMAYRRHVDAAMARLLDAGDTAPDLLDLGLNHEQQHQELLLTDLKALFAQNPLKPAYGGTPVPSGPAAEQAWRAFPGGLVEVGSEGGAFAFDNEGPRHRVFLEAFAIAARPATCREWLAFMEAGGYRRPELWLSDGWDAARREGWNAPEYWRHDGSGWRVHTLQGERAVDPEEAVSHVSGYEADAFARWMDLEGGCPGARLPTEFEWEHAAATRPVEGNFADGGAFHPGPARAGLFGDVWQWTASAYLPYPRFRPAAGAVGEYNGKFMSGQLVLRGGSCATPADHVRATYRNFFPPSARWQFTGLRLARTS